MPEDTTISDEVHRTCEAVGRLMEYWGFSRHMGRVWTLLYLAPEPLNAADISGALAISAGTTSTVTRQLLEWSVIHEVRKPGDRKIYYEAETDLWKMGSRVLAERERNRIRDARRVFSESADTLKERAKELPTSDKRIARFRRERIQTLAQLCQTADDLIDVLVNQRMLDLKPFPDDIS